MAVGVPGKGSRLGTAGMILSYVSESGRMAWAGPDLSLLLLA